MAQYTFSQQITPAFVEYITRDLLSAFPVQTTSIVLIDNINRQQTEINSVKTPSKNDTKWETLYFEFIALCQMTSFGIEQFTNERFQVRKIALKHICRV